MTENKELTETKENLKKIKKTLADVYSAAESFNLEDQSNLGEKIIEHIDTLFKQKKIHKSSTTVVVLCLAKKIISPTQDIRKCKVFKDGSHFPARSLDEHAVSPFMMKKFGIQFAMKESAMTTKSMEQSGFYTLQYKGNINGKKSKTKTAFLNILNQVEKKREDPTEALKYVFANLIKKKKEFDATRQTVATTKIENTFQVEKILNLMEKFLTVGGSRAPVIIAKTLFDLMVEQHSKYNNKKIKPLEAHTASDSKTGSVGDIEICENDKEEKLFEGLEIKHNIACTPQLLRSIQVKVAKNPLPRYYFLTSGQIIENKEDVDEMNTIIQEIYVGTGCDVFIGTIQSYLRFGLISLKNPNEFINRFSKNLSDDAKNNSGSFTQKQLSEWKNLTSSISN